MTPSYNQAQFLEQTLQSVLGQEYPRLEYLVADGASTDGSKELIQQYADRLAWWVSEKDAGQGEAINKGLARVKGEIVAWLNSDDYYLPGAVHAAVQAFQQNPDVALVYGDMLAVDAQGRTTNTLTYKQLNLQDLLCFQIIGQPAVFFRREVWEQVGGLDTAFHYLLDHQLWIRMAQHGRILHVPQLWAAARYHAAAKNVAKAAEFGREAFRILAWAEKQPGLAETVSSVARRARASAFRVNARYLLDGSQAGAALASWARAFLIHPPTALARLNILASALLQLSGLGTLRNWVLQRRARQWKEGNS